MTLPTLIDFPYPEPDRIIALVCREPASFFLDSSLPGHSGALYSYAGIKPKNILRGSDNPWPLLQKIIKKVCHSEPFDFAQGKLREESPKYTREIPSASSGQALRFAQDDCCDFFSGGLVGYLSYETARHNFPWFHPQQGPLPDYWFGFYDVVLVLDHQAQKAFLASSFLSENELKKRKKEWEGLLHGSILKQGSHDSPQRGSILKQGSHDSRLTAGGQAPCSPEKSQIVSMPDETNYTSKLKKIKNYLEAGDIYQINYTERFEARTDLSVDNLYKKMRTTSPVPYGALLNAGDFQILSASPELFFEIRGDHIVTRPIKGTSPRHVSPGLDAENARRLLNSIKDRAELLMITDLERNDLGRICNTGSVKVNTLFEVESFSQVHHLVSTVSGRLKDTLTITELFKALFPGGSVTGAPKIRAMQIIAELEEKPRSVYTGALGTIGPGGCQFNMPIRTLTKKGNTVYFHAGGGIVIDSEPEKEFEEMMVKVKGIMEALGVR